MREELAETIHLNETLGAPPPRVLDRLMAAIDAEADGRAQAGAGRRRRLADRLLCQSFAAHDGGGGIIRRALAIALQAFMLVDIFTKPQGDVSGECGLSSEHRNGTFAMVRFARQASAAEITNFLQNYQADAGRRSDARRPLSRQGRQ